MKDIPGRARVTIGPSQGFRPDIEGLRAICVIAVVLYHAFPQMMPGGFIGVDVFFVISGYLITRLLLREVHDTGRISLLRFWQRRIRRILPAATFVLLCVTLLILAFPMLEARELGLHIVAAALFYHNIFQAQEAVDYLGAPHDENPLLHYWSLSVEEQFYVLWPLLLVAVLFAVRGGGRNPNFSIAAVAAGLWAVSFGYSVTLANSDPAWAFFGTPSRAWQLLSGALLAIVEPSLPARHTRAAGVLSLICLAVLGLSFVLISGRYPYPGILAAPPTLAAAVLIYANAGQATWAATALGRPMMRFIGRMSFSWYLWHWPLLVFGALAFGDDPVVRVAMIALSFALAVATFYSVEQPLRHGAVFTPSLRNTTALGIALIGAGLATGIAMRHLAPDKVHIGNNVYVSGTAIKRDEPVIYNDGCLLRFTEIDTPSCRYGAANGARTVVLFGDSHAGNWFDPLNAASGAEDWQLLVRIKASCRPIDAVQTVEDGGRERTYHECTRWLETVLNEIEALQPDLIVVAGTRHDFPVEAEKRVLMRLAAAGPTLVMRDTPWLPMDPVACLRNRDDPAACAWSLADLLPENNYPSTPEDALSGIARVVDFNDRVCPNGRCQAVLDGQVVMFDAHHLTTSFAMTFVDQFRALLADEGR